MICLHIGSTVKYLGQIMVNRNYGRPTKTIGNQYKVCKRCGQSWIWVDFSGDMSHSEGGYLGKAVLEPSELPRIIERHNGFLKILAEREQSLDNAKQQEKTRDRSTKQSIVTFFKGSEMK